jgi:hypothetical protein
MRIVSIVILLFLVLVSGCTSESPEKSARHSTYDLGITTRGFLLGVIPNPANYPNSSFDDLTAAYEETGQIAEVSMVWTGTNIGQTEKLKGSKVVQALRTYGIEPILTLSFATLKEVPGEGLVYAVDAPEGVNPDLKDPEFRELWVEEARTLAREFRPLYISLGNEVNDYFFLHPDDLDDYVSLVGEAYSAIKQVSPETEVMVVFSYTHLIDNEQWDLFQEFHDKVDLFGLTTYPWKHFDSPEEIPQDYYTRISEYTSLPLGFTEIGWISSGEGSEEEQARYLASFPRLVEGLDVEMVNWLFLHETGFSGLSASITEPETASISLKNRDGSPKEVYSVWLDLAQIKFSG